MSEGGDFLRKDKRGARKLRAIVLNELLESTVDWGADGDTLVEVDGSNGTLADTLWSEFEFL